MQQLSCQTRSGNKWWWFQGGLKAWNCNSETQTELFSLSKDMDWWGEAGCLLVIALEWLPSSGHCSGRGPQKSGQQWHKETTPETQGSRACRRTQNPWLAFHGGLPYPCRQAQMRNSRLAFHGGLPFLWICISPALRVVISWCWPFVLGEKEKRCYF